ncbi:MAG: hypothetical protein JWO58_1224 [Chitinophagaceae bacterium]|nr:hypothetical protein [Chitinophagaceae bacterium]
MLLIKNENAKTMFRFAVFLIVLGIIIFFSGYAGKNYATACAGVVFANLSFICLLFIRAGKIVTAKVLWGVGTPLIIFVSPYFFSLTQPTSIISYSYLYLGGMLFCAYSFQDPKERSALWISITLFFLGLVFYDQVMISKSFMDSPYADMFVENYWHFKLTQVVHFITLVYLVIQIHANKIRIESKLSEQIERLKKFASTMVYSSKNKTIYSGNLVESLEEILLNTAGVLDVSRIGVWEYDEGSNSIELLVGYNLADKKFTYGGRLNSSDYPIYFKSLLEEKIIVANEALTDVKTAEFETSYLLPLNIKSMMDAPFFIDGKFKGILCCEEQRYTREWDEIDQLFSVAVTKLISISFYCAMRKEQYSAIAQNAIELKNKNDAMESIHQRMMEANADIMNNLFWKDEEKLKFQKIINEFSFKNSHDVRGPLSRILGLLEIYRQDPDPENKAMCIAYIEKSAKEMDEIVKEIALVLDTYYNKYSN